MTVFLLFLNELIFIQMFNMARYTALVNVKIIYKSLSGNPLSGSLVDESTNISFYLLIPA
ncbi:hypothetical protein DJ71_10025 [Halorubrum sp. E3]|nr:hypothetical protein DJ71_10025 [Halorubrum sp. E3]